MPITRNHLAKRQRLSASDSTEQLFLDFMNQSQFMRKPRAADLRGELTGLGGEVLIERHPSAVLLPAWHLLNLHQTQLPELCLRSSNYTHT